MKAFLAFFASFVLLLAHPRVLGLSLEGTDLRNAAERVLKRYRRGDPLYCIVIDAGSTGTRAHVFTLRPKRLTEDGVSCGHHAVEVEVPEFSQRIQPGIGEVLSDSLHDYSHMQHLPAVLLSRYLAPLRSTLDRKTHPSYFSPPRDEVLLLFRATAGVRALSQEAQKTVMQAAGSELATWGYFFVPDSEMAAVMSGEEEGIMSWFVLNQLIGGFPESQRFIVPQEHDIDHANPPYLREDRTAAMIEMGGGSAQVVRQLPPNLHNFPDTPNEGKNGSTSGHDTFPGLRFTPLSFPATDGVSKPHGSVARLQLCGETHHIWVLTLLDLGRQAAFAAMQRSPPSPLEPRNGSSEKESPQPAPWESCLHPDPGTSATNRGQHLICRRYIKEELLKHIPSLGESGLPPLPEDTSVYATESYYYFVKYVLLRDTHTFTPRDLDEMAAQLCAQSADGVASAIHPSADPEKHTSACFGLTFLSALLTQTLGIPPDREVKTVLEIQGGSLSWTTGFAALYTPVVLEELEHAIRLPFQGTYHDSTHDEL